MERTHIMYKVGDYFKRTDGHFFGLTFHIVGAVKASPSGPCFLASVKYGWSFTGEAVQVKDAHHITEEEFAQMTRGHKFEPAKDIRIMLLQAAKDTLAALEDRYDGAADSRMSWMVGPIECLRSAIQAAEGRKP